MYCKNCGNEINENQAVCLNCGDSNYNRNNICNVYVFHTNPSWNMEHYYGFKQNEIQ